jgi:inosine-uridine nucleoside N-ribohydrolase
MQQSVRKQVIFHGDFGGDEAQAFAAALAHPDQIDILGATTTFGNVSEPNVFQNAKRVFEFLKADGVKLYRGAKAPSDRESPLLGDGAHPVIGFLRDPLNRHEETQTAVDFILTALDKLPPGSVHISASGPLTNIAKALRQDRETMMKVAKVVIMGGCTIDMPAKDVETRRGNITPHAEFNFQQASLDAKIVMESGLPITLLPMNCTHQLTLTPERHQAIFDSFAGNESVLRALLGTEDIQRGNVQPDEANPLDLGLLNAPASLDMRKFGISPVMHDVHCALYMLYPEQYEVVRGRVDVNVHDGEVNDRNMWGLTHGRTEFVRDDNYNLEVATGVRDPELLFRKVLESFEYLLK